MARDIFLISSAVIVCLGLVFCTGCQTKVLSDLGLSASGANRLVVEDYIDKMKASWIGQMAGVGWGAPTEFRYKGQIIPPDEMPQWSPELINQHEQDDLYVEMTFLRTLDLYGFDVSIRQAGINFANTDYELWHANLTGRDNLRRGIAPPDSGHPMFNEHADDIDYQIEADYSGLIAPGMPNMAIKLGEKFGRLMNYGDGLYGGQFVGGMYAEAFFEHDMEKIVRAGLKCIPRESQYAECIRDVLKWYRKYPDDWQRTWRLINQKYHLNPAYRRFSCDKGDFNIDAKINGAYTVMGLLYGQGDPDRTIIIAARCGQDSDCNPSSAAGVLFTTIGYSQLPAKFKSALDSHEKFSHTPYNFPTLVDVCEKLAYIAVIRAGGRIETDADKGDVFVIPISRPKPTALEQCWAPGPIARSCYTEQEMARITAIIGKDLSKAIEKFAPGWKVNKCGYDMDPGLYNEKRGKRNVLVTHPLDPTTGCVISRKIKIPPVKKPLLRLVVGHDARGSWDLIVRANDKQLTRINVGPDNTDLGWMTVEVDLSEYAGEIFELELINQPTGWHYEGGFWAEISLTNA